MYYEEKIIDGVLCYRYSPKAEWTPMGPQSLTKRICELREENRKLREALYEVYREISYLVEDGTLPDSAFDHPVLVRARVVLDLDKTSTPD